MNKKLDYQTLVSRVKNEIINFQYSSELIIIFIELSIIGVLFIRYASTKYYALTQHAFIDPVLLLVLAGIVLLRLGFLYTKKLTHILLAIFVIAEMFIVITAAKIHQLEFQGMKDIIVNTNIHFINYVLVLIILRTLRFDPWIVLLTGLTAAIGWIILILTTLPILEGNTAQFYHYLVHELGRVLVIMFITVILTLATYRARNVLWHGASNSHAIKDLLYFFDSDIAEKITQSKQTLQAGQGEKRNAAVLFVDMRGFTKTTALLSPTEVILMLSEYQSLVVPIIQKHKGVVDKFIGDGIMASFGATSDSTTYAADGLRAVDEIVQAVIVWRQQRIAKNEMVVDVGSGLASGPVVFGIIGDSGRLEYTVIGNAVNLAAKIEKHNKIEHSHAITTHETFKLGVEQGYINHVWPTMAKESKIEDVDTLVDLVVLP